MFKRHASSHMKLIRKSGYVFALLMPFISLSVESKASTRIATENKFLLTLNQSDDSQFNNSKSENTLNFKSESILIAEDSSHVV